MTRRITNVATNRFLLIAVAMAAGFGLSHALDHSVSIANAQISTDNPVVERPSRDSHIAMVALPGSDTDVIRSNTSMAEVAIKEHLADGYVVLGITNDRVYMAKP